MKIIIGIFLGLATASIVLASETGHGEATPMALIPPTVNFVVFFGALVWLLWKPIQNYFQAKAAQIDEAVARAKKRVEDARAQLESSSRKLYEADADVGVITKHANEEADHFEKEHRREMHDRAEKLRIDAKLKVEHERESQMRTIHHELVEEVVTRARQMIGKDSSQQKLVSEKLVNKL